MFRGTPGGADRPRRGPRRRRLPARARLQRGPRGVAASRWPRDRHDAAAVRRRFRPARALRLEIRHSPCPVGAAAAGRALLLRHLPNGRGYPPVWTVRASVITEPHARPTSACSPPGSPPGWHRGRAAGRPATCSRPPPARPGRGSCGARRPRCSGCCSRSWPGSPCCTSRPRCRRPGAARRCGRCAVGVVALVAVCVIGFTAAPCSPAGSPPRWSRSASSSSPWSGSTPRCSVQAQRRHLRRSLSPATAVPARRDDGVFYRVAPDARDRAGHVHGRDARSRCSACSPCRPRPARPACRGLLSAAAASGAGCPWPAAACCRVRRGRLGDRVRAGRHRPKLGVVRLGHPRAARRGQRPADPVHPGLRGRRVPGVRAPGVQRLPGRRANAQLQPVVAEIAGLPGAPVRAEQVASGDGLLDSQARFAGVPTVRPSGTPPVYDCTSDARCPRTGHPGGRGRGLPAGLPDRVRRWAPRPGPNAAVPPNPAQQAVITALMAKVGSPAAADSVRGHDQSASRRPARRRRRSPRPRDGSRRCRPPPGTPGSPLTCPRCAPARSPSSSCHDRRCPGRLPVHPGPDAMTTTDLQRRRLRPRRPGGAAPGPAGLAAPAQPARAGGRARAGRLRRRAARRAALAAGCSGPATSRRRSR